MRKVSHRLSPTIRAELKAVQALPDDRIDLREMPEVTDWSAAKRGVFYRPVKEQITLRLDADVLAWFRTQAPGGAGYQTEINRALRQLVARKRRKAG